MTKFLPDSLPNLQKLSSIIETPITFIDLETTGMVWERHFAIIEIGLVTITPELVVEKGSLVNPRMKIPPHISEITHIYDDMVKDKKEFSHYAQYIAKVARGHILCGYNSKTFDSKGLEKMIGKNGIYDTFDNQLDFFHIFLRCRKHFDEIPGRSGNLTQACAYHGIHVPGQAHRASYDIAITTMLAETLLEKYGFGIIHKDITKFGNAEIKKRYYKYIVENKIRTIS
jgi:DNA polymerase-3 subunit epsilon